ncbi:WecB/TagA/CpsF family glycosyltransferase [Rhodococcus sp. 077-4]|uniref:WecB/TagA/CpsF family glycosyltransferase n=1 Tax=Rhodococcus sp. 077-4 TaxID=2789271 RepID=UPI0039F4F61B
MTAQGHPADDDAAGSIGPTDPSRVNTIFVGSVPFEVTTLRRASQLVIENGMQKRGVSIRLANAFCVARAAEDAEYDRLLNGPGINFPDGTPVVWAMRIQSANGPKPERVRGPSLFEEVIDIGRASTSRHFLLGTTAETLNLLESKIQARYPGTVIAGRHAPEFGPVDDKFVTEAAIIIESSKTDIVWIALGSPKQDFASVQLAKAVGRPCIGVGAAFDFMAGTAREAPPWMQRNGLEWIYRFATEPRRLWSRYTIGNVQFVRSIARHQLLRK